MSLLKKIFSKEKKERQREELAHLKQEVGILLGKFVLVEGGSFLMRSSKNNFDENEDEVLHKVTVDSFYIQEIVVTQELWKIIMGNNPSKDRTWVEMAVTNVTWPDCNKFILKLNSITGKQYRLPTEAEWEYAAKGGNKSKEYIFSGSNNLDEVGWYKIKSKSRIYPVKELMPNELGIYDMSGNVWEWCYDWYSSPISGQKVSTNPKGPDTGIYRVIRGGSWRNDAESCRTDYRCMFSPVDCDDDIGFRLVYSNLEK